MPTSGNSRPLTRRGSLMGISGSAANIGISAIARSYAALHSFIYNVIILSVYIVPIYTVTPMYVLKQSGSKKYIILAVLCVFAFLPLIRFITTGTANMGHCIFCEISEGKQPNTIIEMETNEFVIFKDIKPASTYHYLAVPKRHVENVKSLTNDNVGLVDRMEQGLKSYFEKNNISTTDALFGFHLPPFITVKHLHMHGIAPRSSMTFMHRMIFKPGAPWFKTVEDARIYLQGKA